MRQGSEKLGGMENEMHENMRQLTILQSFGLQELHDLGNTLRVLSVRTKFTHIVVVYPFVRCVYCFANAAASSCSELAAEQSTYNL